jgi:hypothetical protein
MNRIPGNALLKEIIGSDWFSDRQNITKALLLELVDKEILTESNLKYINKMHELMLDHKAMEKMRPAWPDLP